MPGYIDCPWMMRTAKWKCVAVLELSVILMYFAMQTKDIDLVTLAGWAASSYFGYLFMMWILEARQYRRQRREAAAEPVRWQVVTSIPTTSETAPKGDEERANGYLMAAAPELLSCCQNALGAYEALQLAGVHRALPGYRSCLDSLKAAIKKASGES